MNIFVLCVKDYFDVSRREMINNELKWDIFAACLPAFLASFAGREMIFYRMGDVMGIGDEKKVWIEWMKEESFREIYF